MFLVGSCCNVEWKWQCSYLNFKFQIKHGIRFVFFERTWLLMKILWAYGLLPSKSLCFKETKQKNTVECQKKSRTWTHVTLQIHCFGALQASLRFIQFIIPTSKLSSLIISVEHCAWLLKIAGNRNLLRFCCLLKPLFSKPNWVSCLALQIKFIFSLEITNMSEPYGILALFDHPFRFIFCFSLTRLQWRMDIKKMIFSWSKNHGDTWVSNLILCL